MAPILHVFAELVSGAYSVGAKALGVWFVFWAIRRKGEFDYELTRNAKLVRWAVVGIAFALVAEFTRIGFDAARISALVIGLAFLCWPNFAYHLVSIFGHDAKRAD